MKPYVGNIPLQTLYFCTLPIFPYTEIIIDFKTVVWGQSYYMIWPALSNSEYVKHINGAHE